MGGGVRRSYAGDGQPQRPDFVLLSYAELEAYVDRREMFWDDPRAVFEIPVARPV